MAAGKSTVAQRLAERFDRSIHLRGDVFRRMTVSGREDMSRSPSDEAIRQLLLRYRAARDTASLYHGAGFSVIYQDTIIGPVLADVLTLYRSLPLHVVVLCPSEAVVARRERARSKTGYRNVSIRELYETFGRTPRVGLWIDNSGQSPPQTVQQILDNLDRSRIHASGGSG